MSILRRRAKTDRSLIKQVKKTTSLWSAEIDTVTNSTVKETPHDRLLPNLLNVKVVEETLKN